MAMAARTDTSSFVCLNSKINTINDDASWWINNEVTLFCKMPTDCRWQHPLTARVLWTCHSVLLPHFWWGRWSPAASCSSCLAGSHQDSSCKWLAPGTHRCLTGCTWREPAPTLDAPEKTLNSCILTYESYKEGANWLLWIHVLLQLCLILWMCQCWNGTNPKRKIE